MKPKELVEKWVAAFNHGNAEEIAEFYAEDAINHQTAPAVNSPDHYLSQGRGIISS